MSKKIKIKPNVLFHEYGDEAVLLNMNNEIYYALNGTAIGFWQAINKVDSYDDAVQELLNQYDVDEATLRTDLDEFLGQLETMNLITIESL